MTEAELKTKWCPHVRASAADQPLKGNHSNNRPSQAGEMAECHYCIGSACSQYRIERNGGLHNLEEIHYCGLAGKP